MALNCENAISCSTTSIVQQLREIVAQNKNKNKNKDSLLYLGKSQVLVHLSSVRFCLAKQCNCSHSFHCSAVIVSASKLPCNIPGIMAIIFEYFGFGFCENSLCLTARQLVAHGISLECSKYLDNLNSFLIFGVESISRNTNII